MVSLDWQFCLLLAKMKHPQPPSPWLEPKVIDGKPVAFLLPIFTPTPPDQNTQSFIIHFFHPIAANPPMWDIIQTTDLLVVIHLQSRCNKPIGTRSWTLSIMMGTLFANRWPFSPTLVHPKGFELKKTGVVSGVMSAARAWLIQPWWVVGVDGDRASLQLGTGAMNDHLTGLEVCNQP